VIPSEFPLPYPTLKERHRREPHTLPISNIRKAPRKKESSPNRRIQKTKTESKTKNLPVRDEVSRSKESKELPGKKSSGFDTLLNGLGKNYSRPESKSKDDKKDKEIQVGTFNVGGGNEDARKIKPTKTGSLADQVTRGGLDVVALQEIDVGTKRSGNQDTNEEILKDVLRAESGSDWQDAESVVKYSLDDDGNKKAYNPDKYDSTVYVANFEGGKTEKQTVERTEKDEGGSSYQTTGKDGVVTTLDIEKEKLGADGKEDKNGPITVYSAAIDKEGESKEYSVVSGSSIGHDGGTYGNAVLLGPEAKLKRDEDGKIEPGSVRRHDLGANDPGGENRTALAVDFEVGNKSSTIINTHFTSKNKETDDDEKARATQFENLGKIAESHGDDVIIAGDFNTRSGEPSNFNDPDPNSDEIDRIFTTGDVEASNFEFGTNSGVDHELIRWDVAL
jgi:endonuclease/exonuclease/phosphatase family metal-dependent hydrolase